MKTKQLYRAEKLLDKVAFLIANSDSISEGYWYGIDKEKWQQYTHKSKEDYLYVAKKILRLVKGEK